MPTFTTKYTPPGAYTQFLNTNLSPTSTSEFRVPVLIGAGQSIKPFQASVLRTNTTKDSLPKEGVNALTRVGITDLSTDYKLGVDYSLGSGADVDKIVWATPGSSVAASFTSENLDFGAFLSSSTIAANVGTLVTDSYVVECLTSGTGSTRTSVIGGAATSATFTVTSALTVTIEDTAFTVNVVGGDTRAQVLTKINTAISSKGVATYDGSNVLTIAALNMGPTPTVTVAGSTTLKQELGLGNGTIDTFTTVVGVNGTGKVKITPRSTRVSTEFFTGPQAITAIPGLDVLIPNTSSSIVGQRYLITTQAAQIVKNPLVGSTYFVTGTYTKASTDYDLQFWTAEQEAALYVEYGQPSETNTLALGAYTAFRDGAEMLGVVQLNGGTSTVHFQAAIDKLEGKPIYYVVPLTDNPQVISYLRLHVTNESSITERSERVGIVSGGSNFSLYDNQDSAKNINHERLVYVTPSSWKLTYTDNTNVEKVATVGGSYMAACVAVAASLRTPSEPLTRKQVGATLAPSILYNQTQKNSLAAAGSMVIDTKGTVNTVRHQLTTFQGGSIESKEFSIVQIRDFVSVILRQNLEVDFPGTKILSTTPKILQSFVERILEGLVQQEILIAFSSVKVKQNTVDPTQMDISFQASAVYPLNYILVTFSFLRQTLAA